MHCGHKHHNDGDLLYVLILGVIAICFILPCVGVYWLFAGKDDTQRALGLIIVIVCIVGLICGGL